MKIIAEVKTQSPFGFKSPHSFDFLLEKAIKIGDFLSIHTDPRWGGSFKLLENVCKNSGKMILAKGIHSDDNDIYKALKAGAHHVLVVGRLPHIDLIKQCYLELLNLQQLVEWRELGIPIVWNRRNLLTGENKYISLGIINAIMKDFLQTKLIIASFINKDNLPSPSPWGIIVGENLLDFEK